MAISALGFKFTVNSVDYSTDGPMRLNIKKRRERLVYKTLSNEDKINIAYVMSREITPARNLVVSDRSGSLSQNRVVVSSSPTTFTAKTVLLRTDKFLITNQFTTATPTQPEVPLFYVHTLENYNSNLTDFANRTLLSIEFTDRNFNSRSVTEYVLDSTTGKIYNNLENSYNANTGDVIVTFVKYSVKIVDGATTTVEIYHEIVNNKPIYELADFDDLDAYGNIKTGHNVYLIDELITGEQFEITLPEIDRYAYKENATVRLKIVPPVALDATVPWYVRIQNGQFIASLRKTATAFVNHKYQIAEFLGQAYFPFPPYKLQPEQRATWITGNIVKVPKKIANLAYLALYTEVLVYSADKTLKYAYTTNSSLVGSNAAGGSTITYTAGILSVDELNGFLHLSDTILSTDLIYVSYYAEEDEYEFTSINFNPVLNRDILRQRAVFYIAPQTVYTGDLDLTLQYLLVDELGRINFSSQAASGAIDAGTQKLISEDFSSDGYPRHIFYYDIESSTSGLESRASGINSEYINEFSFIDKYTTESVFITSPILPSGFALNNFIDNPRFLVLGDVSVGESDGPQTSATFDVRKQGGGIKEQYRSQALEDQPEVLWYTDLDTFKQYPACEAFLAEYPQTLLTDHGGDFTEEEVREIIERHMAFGGYPVMKEYGINPAVITITPSVDNIWVAWPTYGPGVSYNVYRSIDLDVGYTKQNSSLLVDVSSGNSFTVSGLDALTKYYIKIGAVDTDGDESLGNPVSATTTSS